MLKLQVGKKYRSRSGEIYEITAFNGHTYIHKTTPMWYEGGYALFNKASNPLDLIEEIKEPVEEPEMEFMTNKGYRTFGELGSLRVGDRVKFRDGSFSCYTSQQGLTNDSPARPGHVEFGIILAVNCKVPAIYPNYCSKDDCIPNDTIVFTDSGKTYFTRIRFLDRVV